jgi:diguanylate cyclase (GGDEF)-like protein
LGGDEFIVLLPGVQDTKYVEKIAKSIITSLNQPFFIGEQTIRVGASIGISLFPENSTDPDQMLRQADKAMYEAKNTGKNNYRFSEESAS